MSGGPLSSTVPFVNNLGHHGLYDVSMYNDSLSTAAGPLSQTHSAAPFDNNASPDFFSEQVLDTESSSHPTTAYPCSGVVPVFARQSRHPTGWGDTSEGMQKASNPTTLMSSLGESSTDGETTRSARTSSSRQLPPTTSRLGDPLFDSDSYALRLSLHQLATAAGGSAWSVPPPARPNTWLNFDVFSPNDTPAAPPILNRECWAQLLAHYTDHPSAPRQFVSSILDGITYGLRLGYDGPLRTKGRKSCANLPMLDPKKMDHVRKDIENRLEKGHIRRWTGMERDLETAAFVASPLGAVPKSNGKMRTIHHLSFPRRSNSDTSVNQGIDSESVTLRYETLDYLFDSVRIGIRTGRPRKIWKVDLEDAFRHCIVGRKDSPLLGYNLDGSAYVDCALTFGCKSSPFLFNLYAKALHWIVSSFGITLSHYLDDFFGASDHPADVIQFFNSLASHLGVRISPTKVFFGEEVEVLGITVNATSGIAYISEIRQYRRGERPVETSWSSSPVLLSLSLVWYRMVLLTSVVYSMRSRTLPCIIYDDVSRVQPKQRWTGGLTC